MSEARLRFFLTLHIGENGLPPGDAGIDAGMELLKTEFGDFDADAATRLIRELTLQTACPANDARPGATLCPNTPT